jgi:hypothetical protein
MINQLDLVTTVRISDYHGNPEDVDNRSKSAIVWKDKNGYWVDLYYDIHPCKLINVNEHSLRYAEDAAENWVMGYSDFGVVQ